MSTCEAAMVVDTKEELTDVKDEKVEKPPIPMNSDTISIEVPTDPQCYCGKQRDFIESDFQCSACYKWFHQKCIIFNVGNALPFMTNYHFMCKNCNQANEEVFSRKQANFGVMCQTALANLTFEHHGRLFFSIETDVIPFLEKHWEVLTTQPRKINKSWYANINKTLSSNEQFKTREESGDLKVCLANTDLAKMGPSYDRFRALASQLKTDISKLGITASSNSRKRKVVSGIGLGVGSSSTSLSSLAESGSVLAGAQLAKLRRYPEEGRTRLNQYGFPIEHPFNKDGYRYILVEPDPHAPGRQVWDECDLTAGKPIPGFFYRLFLSPKVLLSTNDRAHQLKLHESQMSVTGDRGYSMIRATHSVCRGSWFYEVTIKEQPEGSHCRLGWSQMLGTMQAPCGYDKFSYSWRSRRGTAFHASKGVHYTDKGFDKGDVIGCLIHLPPLPSDSEGSAGGVPLPETYKERPLIKFKNSYYFEEKDEVAKSEKELKGHPGSKIVYFRNGVCQGPAFENIYLGKYFPGISLYKSIAVEANFGPDFSFAPTSDSCPQLPDDCHHWKPMSDRVRSLEVEQTMADLLHLVDKADQIDPLLCNL